MTRVQPALFSVVFLVGYAGVADITAPGPAVVEAAGASYEIVALGASNTEGRGYGRSADGVSSEQAYPAQLERLLKSEGCDVRVLNAGRAGDTTAGMLARLPDVVGSATKVVILQTGGNDERKGRGADTATNIESLQRAITQRGMKFVMLDGLESIAGPYRLPDGQHFSAEGHARFASYLAPKVRAAGICAH